MEEARALGLKRPEGSAIVEVLEHAAEVTEVGAHHRMLGAVGGLGDGEGSAQGILGFEEPGSPPQIQPYLVQQATRPVGDRVEALGMGGDRQGMGEQAAEGAQVLTSSSTKGKPAFTI